MTDEDAELNYSKIAGYLPMPSRLENIVPRDDLWRLDRLDLPKVWRDPVQVSIDPAVGQEEFTIDNLQYSYTMTLPLYETTMADVIYQTAGRKVAPDHIYAADLRDMVIKAYERSRAAMEHNMFASMFGAPGT